MAGIVLPEVLNHFNVYREGNKLVGISGEVELPDFEAITDTIEGSGIIGTLEEPVTGQFDSMQIKIPFSVLYEDLFSILDTTAPPTLTIRGSMQCMDPTSGVTDYYPLKVVVRGKAKTTKLGKIVKGKKMEPEVELEIQYIAIDINGKNVVTLDKLNFIYSINGKDLMEKIRSQC